MPDPTLDFFGGDRFRAWVFKDRYALEGEQTMEDVAARFRRSLPAVDPAAIDEFIPTFKFVPGGRIIRALGSDHKLTLANCLALPGPQDFLLGPDGIMDTAVRLAKALKLGAGVGLDMSNLRAANAPLKSCGGFASGPVSFMRLYSDLVATIMQGGTRRGAVLLSLKDWHRDLKQFIYCKNGDQQTIKHANISVRFAGKPSAKVLNWVSDAAWNTGEPGVIFDQHIIESFGPASVGMEYESVNACSESPMPAWGICLLGALNLNAFVNLDGMVDWSGLARATCFAVNFLNGCIEYASDHDMYPFPESEAVTKQTRQIGIGFMGLAHALMKMGLPYGTPESIDRTASIVDFVRSSGADLAIHYGNTTLLAGQPTGTTSIIAGTTNGIEPAFALEYTRKDTDKAVKIKDPVFQALRKEHAPEVFRCAHEVHWRERLAMQAELQNFIDNAISSTVNLPFATTRQQVADIFRTAYRLGLKSVTVFREGCKRDAVLNTDGCKSGACDI